ncbi:uncharacterized protein N7479_009105 [Penicillium vulpinum]|uniref:uncharacterized protein n=1 Tax=Penicillium vulpinum TaxID=29845 RepID=UPI002548F268|nr:uncharacterized protein N7479_009105 [Penicillium vulpinum]KAJ5950692.1 hypothetical protein N7479_009105 [Penicillium vulpinum]
MLVRDQVEIKTALSNIRWSQMESDGASPGWITLDGSSYAHNPRIREAGPEPRTAETAPRANICVKTEYRNPSE